MIDLVERVIRRHLAMGVFRRRGRDLVWQEQAWARDPFLRRRANGMQKIHSTDGTKPDFGGSSVGLGSQDPNGSGDPDIGAMRAQEQQRRGDLARRIHLATSGEDVSPREAEVLYEDFRGHLSGVAQLLLGVEDIVRTGKQPTGGVFAQNPYVAEAAIYHGAEYAYKYIAKRYGGNLLNLGAKWVRYVLKNKAIPKGKMRVFERASKVFMTSQRAPTKIHTWFIRNHSNLNLLLEANKWPERTDEAEGKYPLGPFTVHNTLQLDGDDLRETNKVIEATTALIRRAAIPKVEKILYGDIYIVGKLRGHNVLAWYNVTEDIVYLRPLLKAGIGETDSQIHEFGHRYWYKELPKTVQATWRSYHMGQGMGIADTKEQVKEVLHTIRIGQPLPVRVKGFSRGGPPIVTDVQGADSDAVVSFALMRGVEKGKSGRLRLDRIRSHLHQVESRKISFPTTYAATSPEEHFAESFALYVMGKLTGIHKQAFEKLIVHRE